MARFLEQEMWSGGLRFKKMGKEGEWYELRVDKRYRMSGQREGNRLILGSAGMHGEGLGRK